MATVGSLAWVGGLRTPRQILQSLLQTRTGMGMSMAMAMVATMCTGQHCRVPNTS